MELLEDRLLLGARDAEAGVVDVDAQPVARRRQPTSTRPLGVYLIAFETRFCSSRRSRRRSDLTASEQGMKTSCNPLSCASGVELDLELAQQFVDPEADELGPHRAGVEARDVEQRAKDLLDRVERGVDIADEARVLADAVALDQAGDVEAGGVERLQDVVAGGGEKARLGDIGLLGLAFGAAQLGVEALQLVGAFPHAPLERFVGAFERLGRGLTLGVMSVKVVTMPPSGMRLARTSITRSRSGKRSRNGWLAET